ncbi:BTAD domain-containing putative transcriptional regulator [Naumannella cuiyingiana]|uniref:DNA-binding SARP family transcriptional activator n=1 Tax=Naumannella cuiyingiana TaxID=1347891 RepID=A0A7Z0D7U0_9ACTN|nr:DNA-binding SARP family transcriptional activator [Naumannella cuiyingiana]
MGVSDDRSYSARLFGPFTVLRGDRPLGTAGAAPGLTAARTLLKWFLIHPGVRFSPEELAEVIAPGRSNPRNRLNRTLHYLRDYLEPDREGRPSTFIHNTDSGYRFDPAERWQVDYWQARLLIIKARQTRSRGDVDNAIHQLETLAQMDAMVFLPEDIYDDAFAETRAAHESACHEARLTLLNLYLTTQRLPQALAGGLALLDQDPYDESAAEAVAVAHALGGNRIAAIQSLLEFRARLTDDMRIRPSDDLLRLEHQLRSGAPIRTAPDGRPQRG